MRLFKTTASVLATGTLLFGVPAVASAGTSGVNPTSNNTPSATSSQFAQVADGQSMAQVAQEMGSTGILSSQTDAQHESHGVVQVFAWNDSSLGVLGNVVQFSIDCGAAAPGQPLLVTGKTALGV